MLRATLLACALALCTAFLIRSPLSPAHRRHLQLSNVQEFGSHRRDPLWQKRSRRWVLLADDEEAIRKAVGQLLFNSGYQVTACADGKAALDVLTSQGDDGSTPNLLVSDIRMPNMDGLELLRRVRQDKKLVSLPVVLLTAKGMTHDRIEGYDAGADAYIPKPFDGDELVALIDSLLDRHEALQGKEIGFEDLQKDLDEIKYLLVERGGSGVGNGWVERTDVFLAPDEREVLELLAEGLTNKEISQRTYLSTRRVEALLTSMYKKTDVKNRTELVRWAISTGNVDL